MMARSKVVRVHEISRPRSGAARPEPSRAKPRATPRRAVDGGVAVAPRHDQQRHLHRVVPSRPQRLSVTLTTKASMPTVHVKGCTAEPAQPRETRNRHELDHRQPEARELQRGPTGSASHAPSPSPTWGRRRAKSPRAAHSSTETSLHAAATSERMQSSPPPEPPLEHPPKVRADTR